MQEANKEHRKQQERKKNSERNSPNRACMEIHHEFRAASKEPEALQQLNKEVWRMHMGLKKINKAPGDIPMGLMDISQNSGNKKTFRVQNWEQKDFQGNNKAMKIASNFTRILSNENVSPDSRSSRLVSNVIVTAHSVPKVHLVSGAKESAVVRVH